MFVLSQPFPKILEKCWDGDEGFIECVILHIVFPFRFETTPRDHMIPWNVRTKFLLPGGLAICARFEGLLNVALWVSTNIEPTEDFPPRIALPVCWVAWGTSNKRFHPLAPTSGKFLLSSKLFRLIQFNQTFKVVG